MVTPMYDRNRSVYERASIVSEYTTATGLTAAEQQLLARYHDNIAGGEVLDLGVGAGRTTPHLTQLAASYVGVDFSEGMVAACRQNYPHLEFRRGDARDLSAFPAGRFDFVLFAFNGIDYVGDADRTQVLQQVARVLKPGGVFMFSSHSLESVPRKTFLREVFRVRVSYNPVSWAKALVRVGRGLLNYARNASAQHRSADHAVLTDPAHGFALQTYYVTEAAQRRQLVAAGFSATIDTEAGTEEAVPYYRYYVARKATAG